MAGGDGSGRRCDHGVLMRSITIVPDEAERLLRIVVQVQTFHGPIFVESKCFRFVCAWQTLSRRVPPDGPMCDTLLSYLKEACRDRVALAKHSEEDICWVGGAVEA